MVTCLRLLAEAKSLLNHRCFVIVLSWRGDSVGRTCCLGAAARAFVGSLLERRLNGGRDGEVPQVTDVVQEYRHAGLGLI